MPFTQLPRSHITNPLRDEGRPITAGAFAIVLDETLGACLHSLAPVILDHFFCIPQSDLRTVTLKILASPFELQLATKTVSPFLIMMPK